MAARAAGFLPPESLETVTLGIRSPLEGAATSATYARAWRHPSNREEMQMNGAVHGTESIWFTLLQLAETVTPKIGDKITDSASVVWQIKKIDRKLHSKIHRCFCIRNK